MARKKSAPPEPRVEVQIPEKGRSRKAVIKAYNDADDLVYTDEEDLVAFNGVKRAAKHLAEGLKVGLDLARKLVGEAYLKELNRLKAEAASPGKPENPGNTGNPEGGGPAGDSDARDPVYFVRDGQHCRLKFTADGESVVEPLCNFACKVVEESVRDDGSGEVRLTLVVEGSLDDGTPLPRCQVSAADFGTMNWPLREWGTRAIVNAGMGAKDHLRAAVQHNSGSAVRRTVFLHTGWRRLGDVWVYLHAGGAVGPSGAVPGVVVDLDQAIARYRLPDPPAGATRVRAVQASLRLADGAVAGDSVADGSVAPARLTIPLLAAVYRAPVGEADCSVSLIGPTGLGKSELCALAQQHYGATMDRLHLPGNWISTGNSLEARAFLCKDALLTLDDFKPGGAKSDIDRLHALADRVLRGQGNLAGRGRCQADGSLRPDRPPRGLIVFSGETDVRGESLRARNLTLFATRGDVNFTSLGAFQQDAAAGLYAQSMSAYLQWLAPQYDALRAGLRDEHALLRSAATQAGQHARVPSLVADLHLGLRYFLTFAHAVGAIGDDEKAEREDAGWRVLLAVAEEHSRQIIDLNPARRFLQLLAAALAAGRVHMASKEGGPPEKPETWGWRQEQVGAGEFATTRWKPSGACVGWLDGADLFLEPDTTYAEVQNLASDQGEVLPVSQNTLGRRLKEHGLLVSHERDRTTVRRDLQGRIRVVIHTSLGALYPPLPGFSGFSGFPGVDRTGSTPETPETPETPVPGGEGANGVVHDREGSRLF
jgi:hypothetical protein